MCLQNRSYVASLLTSPITPPPTLQVRLCSDILRKFSLRVPETKNIKVCDWFEWSLCFYKVYNTVIKLYSMKIMRHSLAPILYFE
jgi:hypothetical protein